MLRLVVALLALLLIAGVSRAGEVLGGGDSSGGGDSGPFSLIERRRRRQQADRYR